MLKNKEEVLLFKTYIKENINSVIVSHNEDLIEDLNLINYSIADDSTNYSEEFYRSNNKIICYIKDENGSILGKACSICHIDDEFDLRTGVILARARAMQKVYENTAKKLAEIL